MISPVKSTFAFFSLFFKTRVGIEGAMKYIVLFKGWPKVITEKTWKTSQICIPQEGFEFAFYNEPKQKGLVLIRTSVEDNSENMKEILKQTKKYSLQSI